MANFPAEIASFPFYSTFHQILMAAVNANQSAQLSYIRNLQMITFKPNSTDTLTALPHIGGSASKAPSLFDMSGELNMVEFNSDLESEKPNPDFDETIAESASNPRYIRDITRKHIKVPLLAIVDVRPMAIDNVTADLSIILKSEFSSTKTSKFDFGQEIDVELDLKFLSVKSHTSIAISKESSQTQGTTREYSLSVHMEASTQPLNAPLQNIIDYLIRTEEA